MNPFFLALKREACGNAFLLDLPFSADSFTNLDSILAIQTLNSHMDASGYDPITKRPVPCERCRFHRKRCTLERPHCSRCLRMETLCVYPPPPSSILRPKRKKATVVSDLSQPAKATSSPTPISNSPSPMLPRKESSNNTSGSRSLLNRIIDFADSDTCLQSPEPNEVEHADYMPTQQDFELVVTFFASTDRMVRSSAVHRLISKNDFLAHFFTQPHALRLTICALAAHSNSRLPDHVCVSYYNRARKAVMHCIDRPSVKNLQTLYLIANFAIVHGQPSIGKPFFVSAVMMLISLHMTVDPDFSPWLQHLNLLESEKEERRRIFWQCFYSLKMVQSATAATIPANITAEQMKPPSGDMDSDMLTIQPNCAILELIIDIKKIHAQIPQSVQEILISQQVLNLTSRLISIYNEIPRFLILIPDPSQPVQEQYNLWTSQLMSVGPTDTTGIISLSILHNSSICLLSRPKLYLTHFHPNPNTTGIAVSTFLAALQGSLIAACRISNITRFLLHITNPLADATSTTQPVLPKSFWEAHNYLAHPLFECAVVLWFMACRAGADWIALLADVDAELPVGRGREGRVRLDVTRVYACLDDVLHALCVLDALLGGREQKSNMVTPMVRCVRAMIVEVEEVMEANSSPPLGRKEGSPESVDSVVVGMKVLAIGATETTVDGLEEDPWCFLGLLGLEVGGLRWRAPYEEGWRNLWATAVLNFPSAS
ncbi:hypothetical protein BC830DRAFT_1145133 [Chytriomyces sp. MP71]|nr:hypothetical protein BC830DRAFT_1145133 [Chytriomyces sp. MP71]